MHLDLLVPTFNRRHLLEGTLRSIARAERPLHLAIRVVVVNNDASRDIPGIETLLAELPYPAAVLHEPAPGKSSALNTAVSASSADYIGLIDDDEQIDGRWFRVVEEALAGGDLDFVGGRSLAIWDTPPPGWLPRDYPAVLGITDMGPHRRLYGPDAPGILCGGNAVIARPALHRIGLFCSSLGPRLNRRLLSCEDEDLYWRLLDSGARGLYVPELIVHHRMHRDRLTRRYHRAWAFWNGASKAVLGHRRPSPLPKIAGVPRYLYGEALRGMVRLARLAFTPGAAAERVSAELTLWHLAGHLYGHHLPERAAGTRIAPASPVGLRGDVAAL